MSEFSISGDIFSLQVKVIGLICLANGSSSSEAVAIDSNPPMNAMTDGGSTKEAADDPWKSGLRRGDSHLIASAAVCALQLKTNPRWPLNVSSFPVSGLRTGPWRTRAGARAPFCTFLQRSRREAPSSILAAVSCVGAVCRTVEHKHAGRRCKRINATVPSPPRHRPPVADPVTSVGRDIFPVEGAKKGVKIKPEMKMFSTAEAESSCHTLLDCERRHTAELHTSSQARGLYILNNICLSFSSLSFTLSSAEGDKQANMHGDHKPLSWSLDRLPHMLTKITVYRDCVLFCLAARGPVWAARSRCGSPGPAGTWIPRSSCVSGPLPSRPSHHQVHADRGIRATSRTADICGSLSKNLLQLNDAATYKYI